MIPPATSHAPPDPRRWLALTALLAGTLMDVIDVTIVNVAIPHIQEDLGASYTAVQWTIAGYALTFALLLITGGRLGDIYGRKRLFMLGIAGFTVASALCGFSVNAPMLIAARVAQGAMAGLMVPQVLATVHVTFPKGERAKVFGIHGAIGAAGTILGPVLGGILVQADLFGLSWRPIFLINLPVGLVALLIAARAMGESKAEKAPRLDLVGMGLAALGLLMVIYPLTEGRSLGWPVWCFVMMAAGVAVLAVFAVHQRAKTVCDDGPLMPTGLFAARSFSAGIGVQLLITLSLSVFFLAWMLYLQIGLGYSALRAGLAGLPFSVAVMVGAGLAMGALVPRFGRTVLQAGAVLMIAGLLLFAWQTGEAGASIGYWQMAWPMTVFGLGMGMIVAPLADTVLTDVPAHDAGAASGVTATAGQLGSAFGAALVAVVFFGLLPGHATNDDVTAQLRKELAAGSLTAEHAERTVTAFTMCHRDRSDQTDPSRIPPSCRALASANSDARAAAALRRAGEQANAQTYTDTVGESVLYVTGLVAAALLLMFALPRKVRQTEPGADQEDTPTPTVSAA
ncbi:MFS transporter [Streptomyces hesseae]|uniref:MFS transporter n=1 Tax=Streptomyces hesseae TaxID=3075519 RepID=A0ABU2SJZ1_9ACTN|nr:MFS transporter [Streptomyces sp. DSM 40473]MDT0449215.1 MFS transporter [Streptomyces sp. DSM 40473]